MSVTECFSASCSRNPRMGRHDIIPERGTVSTSLGGSEQTVKELGEGDTVAIRFSGVQSKEMKNATHRWIMDVRSEIC